MSVLKAYTGDLLNRQTQTNKRRHSFFGSSVDEVLFGFSSVFDKVEVNGNDASECVDLRSTNTFNQYPTKMCNNYPRCHEHTVKLFVNRITDNVVNRGVMNVMTELQVDYIDNLVVSVDGSITDKELDGVWRQMENEKKSGRVNSIGIADLTEDKLRHICEWSSIAPDIHQVCFGTYYGDRYSVYIAKQNISLNKHNFRFARSNTTARPTLTQLSIWVTSITFGQRHMVTHRERQVK